MQNAWFLIGSPMFWFYLGSEEASFAFASGGIYMGSEGALFWQRRASTKMCSATGARNPTEHNSGPVRAQFGFRIFLYLILYFSVEKNKERTTKHLKQREKTRRTPETKPEKNQERN